MQRIVVWVLPLLVQWAVANGQKDSSLSSFTVSGMIDVYYLYDFGNPADHQRPGFVYAYNRHNEVALNLGMIKASYSQKAARANFAMMAGTYANANLANEPGVFKNILEANVGIKLSKTKDLWIDAGIFSSHIGWESAMGKDCWTITRSMAAENSPYYESGAKISYTTNNSKWLLSALLLNGWQHMQRPDGHNATSFGYQLTYKPNNSVLLNNSFFAGSDTPDSTKLQRYFQDIYGQFQLSSKWYVLLGFDIGIQQQSKGSNKYNTWYTPAAIVKYVADKKISLAARGEYYADDDGVMIRLATNNGFRTFGYSVNADYRINENIVWRLEYGMYASKDDVFYKGNTTANSNKHFITALCIEL